MLRIKLHPLFTTENARRFRALSVGSGGQTGRRLPWRQFSGSFASCDAVGGREVDRESLNLGRGSNVVLDQLIDRRILFAIVALCILLRLPGADGKDAVRLRVRHQDKLVNESRLVAENGQSFLSDGMAEFPGSARLGLYFNNAGKHPVSPFVIGQKK